MSKIKSNTKMDNWIFNPLQLFSIIKKKTEEKKNLNKTNSKIKIKQNQKLKTRMFLEIV